MPTPQISRETLTRRLTSNAAFAVLDVVLTKACTMLMFVGFVRLLPVADRDEAVAAVTVAWGWVVLLAFLEVTPIRVLLRDHPRFAGSDRKRNRFLTGMAVWWLGQAVLILVGAGLIAVLADDTLPFLGLAVVALTVDFLAQSIQFWVKTAMYAAFRQRTETLLSLGCSLLRLSAVLVAMWLRPSVTSYVLALAGAAVLIWGIYVAALFGLLRFRPVLDRMTLPRLRRSVGGYGLWDHLNLVVIDTLFLIDPLVLERLVVAGRANAAQVAAYGLALRVASMLIILPQQLTRTLQVALANAADPDYAARSVRNVRRLCVAVSLAQFAVVAAGAPWVLTLLFGAAAATPEAVQYLRLLSAAVAVIGVAWPAVGVLNHAADLRRVFVRVFLPVLPLGLAGYALGGLLAGPAGVATANIAVYTLLAVVLTVAAHRVGSRTRNRGRGDAEERSLFRR